jgi:hypothetical protein
VNFSWRTSSGGVAGKLGSMFGKKEQPPALNGAGTPFFIQLLDANHLLERQYYLVFER